MTQTLSLDALEAIKEKQQAGGDRPSQKNVDWHRITRSS
jgi:hypothetical protein